MNSQFPSVAAVTVICYLVATILKNTRINNKWLPAICGLVGGITGVFSYFLMQSYPADDVITAFAVGIVSGLAATGINQTYKQLSNKSNDSNEDIN